MFSFCYDKHEKYKKDYEAYMLNNQIYKIYKNNIPSSAKLCKYESDICNLWFFESKTKSNQCFLVVPSLFNSLDILLFDDKNNYIDSLRSLGSVYLIEWKEVNDSLVFSDYTKLVLEILDNIPSSSHLVGHCIGGNISIISCFSSSKIASLTLLTTPWDYSHFANAILLSEYLDLRKSIDGMIMVPKLYMQIMFFMLFPNDYQHKITKYSNLDSKTDKTKYLKIEQWIQSGINIPASLYNELLDDILLKNSLIKNFDLSQINVPTCVICAKKDRIAPISSVLPLCDKIKDSTLISVDGGHISYLVNNNEILYAKYSNWLINQKC